MAQCYRRFIRCIAIYAAFLLGIMWWEVQSRATELPLQQRVEEEKIEPAQLQRQISLPAKPEAKAASQYFSWYYTPNQEHLPVQTNPAFRNLLEKYGGIWLGSAKEKYLYLTFDEGYENGYTPKILDILQEEKVPAAFFITEFYLRKNLPLVRRMLAEGHQVGNHTSNHYSLPHLAEPKITEEIANLAGSFQELTGQKMAPYLRPPMGEFNELSLWVTGKLGYTSVFWSLAYRDWETNNQRGREYAYQQVMAHHHPGAVILLHAVSQDNTAALTDIIRDLKKLGYEFKPLTKFQ